MHNILFLGVMISAFYPHLVSVMHSSRGVRLLAAKIAWIIFLVGCEVVSRENYTDIISCGLCGC